MQGLSSVDPMTSESSGFDGVWDHVLGLVEDQLSPHKEQTDEGFIPLLRAIDRMTDILKSPRAVEVVSRSLIESRILPILFQLFDHPQWIFSQYITFGLIHIFRALPPKDGDEILRWKEPKTGKTLVDYLSKGMHSKKREVRDATGQCVGAIAEIVGGNAVEEFFSPVFSRLNEYLEATTFDEQMEGIVISIGYALSRAGEAVSLNAFETLVDMLVRASKYDANPGFSYYVRQYAMRAFGRVFSRLTESQRWDSLRQPVLDSMLSCVQDSTIEVRRHASRFADMWFASENCKQTPQEVVSLLLDIAGKESSTWETHHGINMTLALLCSRVSFVRFIPESTISVLFAWCYEDMRKDWGKSGGSAGVEALRGMSSLFLSLLKLPISEKDSDDLVSSMESLSLQGCLRLATRMSSSELFEQFLFEPLMDALCSTNASVLDGAAHSILLILNEAPDSLKERRDVLLSRVHKNSFHASLPIRDTALRCWRRASQLYGCSENELLSLFTPNILDFLKSDVVYIDNAEFREMVYKGFSCILSQANPPDVISTFETVQTLFALFGAGSSDPCGGTQAEFPQSAATSAFAPLVPIAARVLSESDFANFVESLLGLVSSLFFRESELVIVASLEVVRSFISTPLSWNLLTTSMIPFLGTLYCDLNRLAFHENDSVRPPALLLCASLEGHVLSKYPTEFAYRFLTYAARSFSGIRGVTEVEQDDENIRETNVRGFHRLCTVVGEAELGSYSISSSLSERSDSLEGSVKADGASASLFSVLLRLCGRALRDESLSSNEGMLAHVCYAFSTVSGCPGAVASCRCVPSYRSAFVAVLSVVLFRLRSTVVDGDFESYSVAVETDEEGEDPFAISEYIQEDEEEFDIVTNDNDVSLLLEDFDASSLNSSEVAESAKYARVFLILARASTPGLRILPSAVTAQFVEYFCSLVGMAASISADFAALFHTVCSSSFAVLSPVLSKTSAFQVMQQGIASPEMVLGEDFFDLDFDEASDRLSQVVSGLDSIAFSDVSTLYAFVTAIQRAIFSRSDVQAKTVFQHVWSTLNGYLSKLPVRSKKDSAFCSNESLEYLLWLFDELLSHSSSCDLTFAERSFAYKNLLKSISIEVVEDAFSSDLESFEAWIFRFEIEHPVLSLGRASPCSAHRLAAKCTADLMGGVVEGELFDFILSECFSGTASKSSLQSRLILSEVLNSLSVARSVVEENRVTESYSDTGITWGSSLCLSPLSTLQVIDHYLRLGEVEEEASSVDESFQRTIGLFLLRSILICFKAEELDLDAQRSGVETVWESAFAKNPRCHHNGAAAAFLVASLQSLLPEMDSRHLLQLPQLVTDVVTDEDCGDFKSWILSRAAVDLCLSQARVSLTDVPVLLPTPTPVSTRANETFSSKAVHQ